MNKSHYNEMRSNLEFLIEENAIQGKTIYLFGHCNATEELTDLLLENKFSIAAILDNNVSKHGKEYKGILIKPPQEILTENQKNTIVLIVARAYAAMADQLKRLGYDGSIRKLVDYNSYAEYSLSKETIVRMKQRVERGQGLLKEMEDKYPGHFRFLCPFSALGDIYFMMSYLPHYLKKRGIEQCVIGVIGNACAEVVRLFGAYQVETYSQKEMDETIQAALYTKDPNTFLPHQDRPYVVNLHKALYIKRIPLEQIYCCGVYGLPSNTKPYEPQYFKDYKQLNNIKAGKAVILSPYAKSVTALPKQVWKQIVSYYIEKGYQCFTNVVGEEKPLTGTEPISPRITEMKSVVERAGIFIGIRSGMCDVLKTVKAEKIALFPEYNYCDTRWKATDMYWMEGWENIVVKDDFQWKRD